jgi:hypothetical protein
MAITKTWSITDLERETSDNYVCYVHWLITGTEDSKTVTTDGVTFLDRPSTLVDYATLTEEIVLGWTKAKINADYIPPEGMEGKTGVEVAELAIDEKMAALNVPETATGKPF